MDLAQLLKDEVGGYEKRSWTGSLGGTEVTLYATPLTPADFDKVLRKFPTFMTQTQPAGMALLIASKVTDEDGNRLLQDGQDILFRRLDVTVVGDIFGSLFGADLDEDALDVEAIEGN
jgi:hypothetical protein